VEVMTGKNEWRKEEKTLKIGAYVYIPHLYISDIVSNISNIVCQIIISYTDCKNLIEKNQITYF